MIALIAGGGVSYWAYHQRTGRAGRRRGDRRACRDPGIVPAEGTAIADLLEKKGVVGNAFVFKTWLKAKGASGIQAGQYKMAKHQDADEVLRTLKAGPLQKPSVDLTVLPGSTVRDVPAQIVKYVPAFSTEALTQLIAADQDHSIYEPPGKGLEGFLFPDTYRIAEGADEATVLRTMLTQFDKVAGEVGLDQAQDTAGVDPYSALIVASLVEKEAKVDEDRSKIARVIYNRLASGTPLGVDASLCYLQDAKPCVLHQAASTRGELCRTTPARWSACRRRRSPTSRAHRSMPRCTPPTATGPTTCSTPTSRPASTSSPRAPRSSPPRRRVARPPAWAATDVVLSGRTQVAAVIGDPVEHSLSPAILNAAFAASGLDWAYVAFTVAAGDVARALDGVRSLGIHGLSGVTMPHKEAVAALVDERSPEASLLGAVNCVVNDGGRLVGHNTDGAGFVDALRAEVGFELAARRVVLVGAGGAARAIALALGQAGAADVAVLNRAPRHGPKVAAAALVGAAGRVGSADDVAAADLVVNATPVGMLDALLPIDPAALHPGQVVADIVYRPKRSPRSRRRQRRNARCGGGQRPGHARAPGGPRFSPVDSC